MNMTLFLRMTTLIVLAAGGCAAADDPQAAAPAPAAPLTQDSSNAPPKAKEPKVPAVRRPSLGFRVTYFGLPFFKTTTTQLSTTTPVVAQYTYTGGTSSPKLAVSPTAEYRLTDRLSVGIEFRFHHTDFSQTTTILSGVVNPNASTDDRQPITITQHTQASY